MRYIYKLTDPRDKTVRYIGRTKDVKQRLISHISYQMPFCKKGKWIDELRDEGLSPILDIIEEVEDRYEKQREKHWIQTYLDQGVPLVNTVLPKRHQ